MGNADDFLRRMGIPAHDEQDKENSHDAAQTETDADATTADPGSVIDAGNGTDSTREELRELQLEAESLQRQFSVPDGTLAGHVGNDASGAIRVTAGADGRVTNVQVARSFRETIGESQFDAAVLEAVTDVGLRRLATWGKAVTAPGRDDAESTDGSRPAAPESPDGRPSPPHEHLHDGRVARTAAHEVLSLLEGIEHELDTLQERVRQAAHQPIEGCSPSHAVTVSVTAGGEVTDVRTQRRLLRQADASRLARELRRAFQDAYERAGTLTPDSKVGGRKLTRLQELADDRRTLRRRQGPSK